MSIELKIKSKHLALEPAIIRKEEQKLLKQIKYTKQFHQVNDDFSDLIYPLHAKYTSLSSHRKWDVRNEARATYLARAFLHGQSYKDVECKRHDDYVFKTYIIPRIFAMVAKYGPNKIHKFWNGKRYDFRPEEADPLTEAIKEWSKLD